MPRRSTRIDQQAVVLAAAELADELGSADLVTLAQVAERFGIKVPSLYNHVDGLAGLRRGVALLGMRELIEVLRTAAIGRSGDDALVAVAEAYRAYAHAHPGRYAASLRANPDDAELSALGRQVVGLLLQLLMPYGIAEEDALHAVRGLRAIVHGFSSLEAVGGFAIPLSTDESFRRLVRGFVAGLGRDQGSGTGDWGLETGEQEQ